MATRHHTGHVVPPACTTCYRDADMVVAFEDGDAYPYCFPCGNAVLYTNDDCLEYPIEEYYTATSEHVSQFNPQNADEFSLYNPDRSEVEWICADNEDEPGSSVYPSDSEHR